jgi:colanic acid/amylovoran biosynthesis glycosyltransferase
MARSIVTAEGPALAGRLGALGVSVEDIRLLPLCLPDWALAEPARAADPWSQELHLLQVARFIEKKGIDTSLQAVAAARRRGVPVRLTLVGDGELRPQLEALAGQLELGNAVTWMGFRPYAELPRLLCGAHAFIQPSRTAADGDTEGGHPTTLIEAMAQCVPVIGTRHADIPLVVREGQTGLLADEGDSDGVAAAIESLHRDRERLLTMSGRAREFALRRHHPDVLLALRERIYREAIRARRTA